MNNGIWGISGWCLLIILGVSYFIPMTVDSGLNYTTKDSMLGILIFHNPFILALYLLLIFVLVFGPVQSKRL